MLAKVISCAVVGLDGALVDVEIDVSNGQVGFTLVGLPDAAAPESRERVRASIKNSSFAYPFKRITVNLAPADCGWIVDGIGTSQRQFVTTCDQFHKNWSHNDATTRSTNGFDPDRWGVPKDAVEQLADDLETCWQHYRPPFRTRTRDTSDCARTFWRSQLPWKISATVPIWITA